MKHHVRCVVATIIIALFFSSFNQRVLAMDSTTETQPIEVTFESAQTDKPIEETLIQEIEDKREANVKHFLTDQFRYVAMVYPLSVHYSEDGTWKEIDNTLIDHVDEERNDIVEPKANGVKIRLAKNSQSSKLVSMKSAGLELSWTFKNIAKKAIQVIQPSQHKDDDLTTVEKLTSSVTYLDVFEGVDLEYVLRGDEVKENFILKSNTSQRHFTQVFRFNGLTPKIQDDGTIWLVDANDIMVFRFERFIMVDANGEESQAIQTQLNRVNQTWELSIQPDQSWLDAPERVYPVVVDPTVTTPISVAALDDAHVTASLPTSNFYNSYILKTGYGGANGTKKIKTTTTYSADGNYVATKTDALGNTITTHIDSQSGRLNSVSDPLGRTISYGYHSDDALATVFSTVGGQSVSNSYTYENDRLKSITHNGFSYSFNYDALGQVSQVKVGTIPLITYAYQARTGRLNSSLYGNGDSVEYVYDALDRVVGVKHNGVLKTTYEYDGNGVIGRVSDVISGKSTRYIYDFANRLVKVEESNGNSVAFGYDANNNASTFIDTVNGTTYTTSYTYDKDNRPTLVTSPKANTTGYVYDVLGRLTFKKWNVGAMEYSTTFTYKDHPTDTSLTSTQVASIQNGSNPSISYVYDANGNITSITEGTNTIQYVYNELNEVVRENNQRDNKSFVYHYDLGGNLLSKVEYAYTTATLGTPISTIAYAYTNANWKDQLTSFNGKAITYDAIGNPLTYDGTTYSWQGRQLVSSSKAGLNINYIYNDAGIRTSMSVNGVTTSYRLSGDRVTFEQTGSDTIYYVYDTQGQLISMILNNVEYAYVRNAQNDIVGLINSAGIQVVSYTYSTWGEVLSITGSLASSVGEKNPYRYRGYRYDSETGLYYLQSRYYNPQWGRFLNADTTYVLTASPAELTDKNLYGYCDNNPIIRADDDGDFWFLIGAAVGAVVGGAGQFVSDLVTSFANGKWTFSNWQTYTGAIVGGAVGGAILGGTGNVGSANAASGFVTTGVGLSLEKATGVSDKSWTEIGINAAADGAISFGLGKIPIKKGVTNGRNSMSAVYKSGLTKLRKGIVANMSNKALVKGLQSSFVGGFAMDGYYGLKQYGYDRVKRSLIQ